MRGPLLSGPLGNAVTLRRLAERLRACAPVVVMRSLWMASALAAEFPVVAVLGTPEPGDPSIRAEDRAAGRKNARKALRKAGGKSGVAGTLAVVLADQALPLAPGGAGAVVLEDLSLESPELVAAELGRALPLLRTGGVLVCADRTRSAETEAQLARAFLSLGITHITQDRPREGALLTSGRAPHPAVLAAVLAPELAKPAPG
jgi:hypothetical protein